MLVLDLEQRVTTVVVAQLETLNGQLEAIVNRVLQTELDRRIASILDADLNGRANRPRVANLEEPPPSKTCNRCGQVKSTSEFERGRGTCKTCRREQERQRGPRQRQQADAEDQERPRPGDS